MLLRAPARPSAAVSAAKAEEPAEILPWPDGLKLERSKGPVEIFVIDHAAKPSPN